MTFCENNRGLRKQFQVDRRSEFLARALSLALLGWLCSTAPAEVTAMSAGTDQSVTPSDAPENERPPAAEIAGEARIYIQEYRVTGAKQLRRIEIEEAVYPYLGPGRGAADVEHARAALEKAYHDKGYSTVTVQVPEQSGRRRIIVLEVVEAPISRLRVKGARYFSPAQIKRMVPSLAEGRVPNFKEAEKEIIRLNLPNRFAERRVLPALKPGREANTYEVDLNVKDSLPLHGSLELNNRYSPDTTPLRVNGSINYTNLWQAGHTAGFSFQIAPERTEDAQIYSGYYMAPVPEWQRPFRTAGSGLRIRRRCRPRQRLARHRARPRRPTFRPVLSKLMGPRRHRRPMRLRQLPLISSNRPISRKASPPLRFPPPHRTSWSISSPDWCSAVC